MRHVSTSRVSIWDQSAWAVTFTRSAFAHQAGVPGSRVTTGSSAGDADVSTWWRPEAFSHRMMSPSGE